MVTDSKTTKTTKARKKPVNTNPWTVYAEVKGRVRLDDVDGATEEEALKEAVLHRDALIKQLDTEERDLHVSTLRLTRRGLGRNTYDTVVDPAVAPEPSPALKLYKHVRENATGLSRTHFDGAVHGAVTLAIDCGLHFDPNDFRIMPARENDYVAAVKAGNVSACIAYERKMNRPPFVFCGRLSTASTIEWPSYSKGIPWPSDAPTSWDGRSASITSFRGEGEEAYVVAVARRYHNGTHKNERQFKIPIADMRVFEKLRAEGVRVRNESEEVARNLAGRSITVREDVLVAAPKKDREAILTWLGTSRYGSTKGDRPECLQPLIERSTILNSAAKYCTSLFDFRLSVDAATALQWSEDQRQAVMAWARADAYAPTSEVASLVTDRQVRARAADRSLGLVIALQLRKQDLYPDSVLDRKPRGSITNKLAEQMSQSDLAVLLRLALEFETWKVEVYEKTRDRSLENRNTLYCRKVDEIAKSHEGKMIESAISSIRWAMLIAEKAADDDKGEPKMPVEVDVPDPAAPGEVAQ